MQYIFEARHTEEMLQDWHIQTPSSIWEIMDEEGLTTAAQEELWVLHLNNKLHVTHKTLVHKGTMASAIVCVADVFRNPIVTGSSAVVLVHNHPSGDPMPSPDDVRVTEGAQAVGKLLEIDVLDHVIVGGNRWYSFKEKGLVF